MLHVPDMSMNLVSGDLLGKLSIKSVYESGKLILIHNGVFVGKGYFAGGIIKLCILTHSGDLSILLMHLKFRKKKWKIN